MSTGLEQLDGAAEALGEIKSRLQGGPPDRLVRDDFRAASFEELVRWASRRVAHAMDEMSRLERIEAAAPTGGQ